MLHKILKIKDITTLDKKQQTEINGGFWGGGSCAAFCQDNNDCHNTCGSLFTCNSWGICSVS